MIREIFIPKYPRIHHLVANSSVTKDDRVISPKELESLKGVSVLLFEKLDGANVGITVIDGQPYIRNRNHMLDGKQRALGNNQFSMLWQWVWQHIEQLKAICQNGRRVIYAEWLWKTHSIRYDRLEDWLVVFDILSIDLNPEFNRFYSPEGVSQICKEHGLVYSPIFGTTAYAFDPIMIGKWIALLNEPGPAEGGSSFNGTNRSRYSSIDRKEGLIIVPMNQVGTFNLKYKIVRDGFIQGEHWTKRNCYNELASEQLF